MNKKMKGFSLAELLISLLVISIVLAAAVPAITKRAGQQRQLVWNWTEKNNIAFSAAGNNQGIIIGAANQPAEQTFGSIDNDNNDSDSAHYDFESTNAVFDMKNSAFGNKLSLIKPINGGHNFKNAHIAFYNSDSSQDIKYAGKIAMDQGNIAMGIGALQNTVIKNKTVNSITGNAGENTAIGHFALTLNEKGYRNTAVGKKTLTNNKYGKYNTAVGFGALYNNTNDYNTAFGAMSLLYSEGSYNTAIGQSACYSIKEGNSNICIGYNPDRSYSGNPANNDRFESNNSLYIGNYYGTNIKPLIKAHLFGDGNSHITADLNTHSFNMNLYKDDYSGYNAMVEMHGANQMLNLKIKKADNTSSGDINLNDMMLIDFPDSAAVADQIQIKSTQANGGGFLLGNVKEITGEASNLTLQSGTEPYDGRISLAPSSVVLSAQDGSVVLSAQTGKTVTINNNAVYLTGYGLAYNCALEKETAHSNHLVDVISAIGKDAHYAAGEIPLLWETVTNLSRSVWSDARLKNISGDNKAGLKEINKLEVKNYTYKDDKKKTPHVGVIAQQLMKVFPDAVSKGENGYYRIRTEDIFYAMVNSIKELFAQIQDLTAKITGLDKRITELEQQNKLLKEQNAAFEKRLEALEKKLEK